MSLIEDPIAIAGLVRREVRTAERNGEPTRIVVARRTYATSQEDLWDAVTNAERIPRWFLPVTGELELGGRYQLEGNAGGVVERCDAPTSYEVTWEYGGVSWVELVLEPTADGTTLELRHEAHVPPEFWGGYGPGAVGVGWDLGLMALGIHLSTGAAVDRKEGEEFPLTPAGREFVRAAAASWADAAIADGDDPEAARQAAEATIAFYTVVPEAGATS